MKNLSVIFATVLLLAGVTVSNAQDGKSANHNVNIGISTHALVDIESSKGTSISLSPNAPTEAGLGLDFTDITNSDLWLNYSSIVKKDAENSISAKISGTLPVGVVLELAIGNDNTKGKGKVGKASYEGFKPLTSTGHEVVNEIGSCYTGSNLEDGHNLTYALTFNEESNYEDIVVSASVIDVIYTITEN